MPYRAPSACTYPGCPARAEPGSSRCPAHPYPPRPGRWASGAPGRAMPPGWAATRARILARDPVCRLAMCGGQPSTEVHHLAGPGVEDDAHLIGVCHGCHRAVTLAQAAAARRGGG